MPQNPNLSRIQTIVVLMMENRSFDHMLGYLSLPPFNRTDVDGLSNDPAWVARATNADNGRSVAPFLSNNPYSLPDDFDPPHERENIANHLGAPVNGVFPMNGFVSAIPNSVSANPAARDLVMSYFGAAEVPTNHFLASNFAICDRWFCSLPTGTQPNRLVSMSGTSWIDHNTNPLPNQDLVYDWLTARGISWRVYHQGIPFFTLMKDRIGDILNNNALFRSFEHFESDLTNTPPDQLPQVIFVEPTYGDAPHLGASTDDHAPSGVSDGQEFLMQVYNAVTASPSFWKSAVLIIDYDEHGGFFDHVSPPLIATPPPKPNLYPSFSSLGVRVPGFVVSPFVAPGSVSHAVLDHTSVLKFFAEKFDANGSYSSAVDARPVSSVSQVLDFSNPILDPPAAPALEVYLSGRLVPPAVTVPTPATPLQKAFSDAVVNMKLQGADASHAKFGALLKKM